MSQSPVYLAERKHQVDWKQILVMGHRRLIITKRLHLIIVRNTLLPVVSTIKDRFDQPDYQIYVNLEKTLLNGAIGDNFDDTMAFSRNH